ncbi:MAG: molybdopterin dinucleotide binding domain-containing protein [Minwuia sp.]|uniref:molybdopterin dinucleotide binding domain-containing protein n=1 Tax=Minwuia sp. TaxID=2493630 RepID=UPI003A86DE46
MADVMFGCDADTGYAHMLAPSGVSLEELRASPEGVEVNGRVKEKPHLDGGFPTPSGVIEIWSETLMAAGQKPLPALDPGELPSSPDAAYPLRLGCAKTVAYCHSQGRNQPSLRKLTPDPVAEMAPETAAARGIGADDWIEIETPDGVFAARAKLVEDHTPDAVFAQHGWTGDAAGRTMNMNRAVSTRRSDPVSGSIPLRASWCEVRRIGNGENR